MKILTALNNERLCLQLCRAHRHAGDITDPAALLSLDLCDIDAAVMYIGIVQKYGSIPQFFKKWRERTKIPTVLVVQAADSSRLKLERIATQYDIHPVTEKGGALVDEINEALQAAAPKPAPKSEAPSQVPPPLPKPLPRHLVRLQQLLSSPDLVPSAKPKSKGDTPPKAVRESSPAADPREDEVVSPPQQPDPAAPQPQGNYKFSIAVYSANHGAGCTTFCMQLAAWLARTDARVAVVGGNDAVFYSAKQRARPGVMSGEWNGVRVARGLPAGDWDYVVHDLGTAISFDEDWNLAQALAPDKIALLQHASIRVFVGDTNNAAQHRIRSILTSAFWKGLLVSSVLCLSARTTPAAQASVTRILGRDDVLRMPCFDSEDDLQADWFAQHFAGRV